MITKAFQMGGEAHSRAALFWQALIDLLTRMEPLHLRKWSLRTTLVAPIIYTLDHHKSLQERQAGPPPTPPCRLQKPCRRQASIHTRSAPRVTHQCNTVLADRRATMKGRTRPAVC